MSTTEAELGKLRDDLEKLRKDIEHLGATLGRVARAGIHDAGENACDATDGLRAEWHRASHRLTDKIEDNPLGAALAAMGIGLLLGGLFSGQRN